ncbi:hypothetical protein L226DRAFT_557096 [Lentinus tigrinus ALCF2SS1-7]|uniref:uncharacterized protein n=1 Tax=Lentinus tigrinus ALCF2SS1-7 TaxID=1328758 RepID=UPI001165CA5F|nr:hypothetical protein L226DRAFT_557096 [Lentinus tigrinus ALCF2SS1-7]
MSDVLSSVRSFFRRALGLPMADDLITLLRDHVGVSASQSQFPCNDFTLYFVRILCRDSYRITSTYPHVADYCIIEAKLMREVSNPEHEYLVVLVARGKDDRERLVAVIQCERTVPDNTSISTRTRAAASTASLSSASPLSPSKSLRSTIGAHDLITVYPPPAIRSSWYKLGSNRRRKALLSHSFDKNPSPPTLVELAAAVSAINTEFPDYGLMSEQGYSFAATLFSLLYNHENDNLSLDAGPQPSHQVPEASKVAGTFRNISIVKFDDIRKSYPNVKQRYLEIFGGHESDLHASRSLRTAGQDRDAARAREAEARAEAAASSAREAEAREEAAALREELAASRAREAEKDRELIVLRRLGGGHAGQERIARTHHFAPGLRYGI